MSDISHEKSRLARLKSLQKGLIEMLEGDSPDSGQTLILMNLDIQINTKKQLIAELEQPQEQGESE